VGYVAAIVTGIPMTAHRHEHFAHHGQTNRVGADPDLLCEGMTDSLRALVVKPLSMITNQYQFFVRERWAKVSTRDRTVFLVETAVILGSRLTLLALMLTGFGTSSELPLWNLMLTTAAVLVVGPAAGVIVLVYLFAFIVHQPHQVVGRFIDTSVFEPPALVRSVLTWMWGFQNYHGVHHAFPRVPWYRYRALFEDHKTAILAQGMPVHHLHLARWVRVNR
jgi:beta-carotene hydroxylase